MLHSQISQKKKLKVEECGNRTISIFWCRICTHGCISSFIIHFLLKVTIMCHGDIKLGDILVAQKHYLLQVSISDLLKNCLEPDLAQRKKYFYIYIYIFTIF